MELQEVYSESNLAKANIPGCGWVHPHTQTSQSPRPVPLMHPRLHPHLGNETPVSFLLQDRYLKLIYIHEHSKQYPDFPIIVTLFR